MPKHIGRPPLKPIERFMRFCAIDATNREACWIWTGTTSSGTPTFHASKTLGALSARRWGYEWAHRCKVPARSLVLPRCRNQRCVNPLHQEVAHRVVTTMTTLYKQTPLTCDKVAV